MKRRPHKIVSVVLLVILIAGMGMACRIQSLESRNKRWAENTETAGKILTESGKKEAQKQTDGTENDAAAQNAKRVFGDEPAELYARSAMRTAAGYCLGRMQMWSVRWQVQRRS